MLSRLVHRCHRSCKCWVIQGRRGLRFPLKPGEGLRIPGYILRQELERDETVETSILSFVDDSHTAATKLFNDAVMRDGLADHGRRSCFLARILGAPALPSQFCSNFLGVQMILHCRLHTQETHPSIFDTATFSSPSAIPQQTNHLQVTIDRLYRCAIMFFDFRAASRPRQPPTA